MNFKPLNEYKLTEMSKFQSDLFIGICLQRTDPEFIERARQLFSEQLAYRILVSRLDRVRDKVDEEVVMFTSVLCETPGEAVMYANTLFQAVKRKGKLSWDDFISIFPMGFPNKEEKNKAWAQQKCHTGNFLDTNEAWEL